MCMDATIKYDYKNLILLVKMELLTLFSISILEKS